MGGQEDSGGGREEAREEARRRPVRMNSWEFEGGVQQRSEKVRQEWEGFLGTRCSEFLGVHCEFLGIHGVGGAAKMGEGAGGIPVNSQGIPGNPSR